jgi:hypothetical protein
MSVAEPPPQPVRPAAPQGSPGTGIAGMVCGIVALVLSLTIILSIVGLALAIVGLILSSIGLSQAKARGVSNGMAVAGLVCSLIALLLSGLVVACIASL